MNSASSSLDTDAFASDFGLLFAVADGDASGVALGLGEGEGFGFGFGVASSSVGVGDLRAKRFFATPVRAPNEVPARSAQNPRQTAMRKDFSRIGYGLTNPENAGQYLQSKKSESAETITAIGSPSGAIKM